MPKHTHTAPPPHMAPGLNRPPFTCAEDHSSTSAACPTRNPPGDPTRGPHLSPAGGLFAVRMSGELSNVGAQEHSSGGVQAALPFNPCV